MNGNLTNFTNLSRKDKIQFVAAFVCTVFVIASLPVYAWFSHRRQLAELQKVKTPDLLYISGAYAEDVKYFEIPSINVSDEDNTKHRQVFPFAVAGEYVTSFTLQLAHTTNIPFTYKIYEADYYTTEQSARTAIDTKNESILNDADKLSYAYDAAAYEVKAKWTALNTYTFSQRTLNTGQMLYFVKGNEITGSYKNSQIVSGRTIATQKYHEETYKTETGTYGSVQTYAEPLYWQSGSIQSVPDPNGWGGNPFFKTFLLEISWDSSLTNDKETDMIYISAYRD